MNESSEYKDGIWQMREITITDKWGDEMGMFQRPDTNDR